MLKTNNRIEKKMPAGGKKISPEGIEKVLLSGLDKIKFGAEHDIFSNVISKFRQEKMAGDIPKQFGVDDWLKSKTTEELFDIARDNRRVASVDNWGIDEEAWHNYWDEHRQGWMFDTMQEFRSWILSETDFDPERMSEGGKVPNTKPKDFVERIQKLTSIRSQLDPYSLQVIDDLVEKMLAAGAKKK